jgi:hypothetical protein
LALPFIDDCDLYAVREDLTRRWTPSGTTISYISVHATDGRFGGGVIKLAGANPSHITRIIPARQAMILGFARLFDRSDQPTEQSLIVLRDEGGTQVAIRLDIGAGVYRAYRGLGTTLLAASAPDAESAARNQWHWIELMVRVDPVNGRVEFRRNGTTLLAFDGDTQGSNTSMISRVQLLDLRQTSSNRVDLWVDDVVIADDLGGVNDDFLGDLRISTLVPTADSGQKDRTSDSASDNFSRVAEIAPDDDTSYVASATSGARDLYTIAPLGVTPLAIKGLQHTTLARKDDAGDRALSLGLKSGTEVAVGPAAVLGSTYSFVETMHEQDPATGEPWTPAAIDSVQAGMEVAP